VWQSSLSDSRQSKFGWNLAGGSIEISDFGADVNSRAPLNYSVFTRQVQLGRSTKSGGITLYCDLRGKICMMLNKSVRESPLLHPVVFLILFFRISKTFLMYGEFHQNVVLQFIMQ